MVFNTGKLQDFQPELRVDDNEIQVVDEMRILGLIIRSDMKWSANTEHIVIRAFRKLWMLRRLKSHGASTTDLLDVYIKQVRCLLELAVPAWHSGLTKGESTDIERVQRAALQIILGLSYTSYGAALDELSLDTLEDRIIFLCRKFGNKALKHPKHRNWFKNNTRVTVTRAEQPMFCPVISKTKRFENSPLSYLTSLLNKYSKTNK